MAIKMTPAIPIPSKIRGVLSGVGVINGGYTGKSAFVVDKSVKTKVNTDKDKLLILFLML